MVVGSHSQVVKYGHLKFLFGLSHWDSGQPNASVFDELAMGLNSLLYFSRIAYFTFKYASPNNEISVKTWEMDMMNFLKHHLLRGSTKARQD